MSERVLMVWPSKGVLVISPLVLLVSVSAPLAPICYTMTAFLKLLLCSAARSTKIHCSNSKNRQQLMSLEHRHFAVAGAPDLAWKGDKRSRSSTDVLRIV